MLGSTLLEEQLTPNGWLEIVGVSGEDEDSEALEVEASYWVLVSAKTSPLSVQIETRASYTRIDTNLRYRNVQMGK